MKAKTDALSPEEANIRKLSRSPIPMNFVKKHNGQWNHQDWLDFLADISGGDARHALNAIELGVMTTNRGEDGKIHITLDVAQECIQKRAIRYDKTGDNHYDTISAFIKSMRGSDPDAAVYYLARMLYAGEDIKFIARRIMICASEDVGNADPQALQVAVAASLAVERVGMPEAQLILAQAVTYVATAPKSNACCGIFDAMAEVKKFSISSLITRTTNDITQVQMLVSMGMQVMIKAPITAVWAITKIAGKEWQWSVAALFLRSIRRFLKN